MVARVVLVTDSMDSTNVHISGFQRQENSGIDNNINSEMDNRVVIGHFSQVEKKTI